MTRIALAVIVAGHGLIHLIGFVVPWHLATLSGFPYRTDILVGTADVGDAGALVIGVMWLACAVGFLVAATGLLLRSSWALRLTATLAVVSLLLCAVGLPETFAGIAVNATILGWVTWVSRPALSQVPS